MAHNNSAWPSATYTIKPHNADVFAITVKGRDRWSLEQLIQAGSQGCTPINNPAPRWSAYIHNLRSFGVPIATHTELHKGPFAGTHARYELLASATPADISEAM